MPFDQGTYLPSNYMVPRKSGDGRGQPISEDKRNDIHALLRAGRSNAFVMRATGIGQDTVTSERRKLVADGILEPTKQDLLGQERLRAKYEKIAEAFLLAIQREDDTESLKVLAEKFGLTPVFGPMIRDILLGQTNIKTLQSDHKVKSSASVWVERLADYRQTIIAEPTNEKEPVEGLTTPDVVLIEPPAGNKTEQDIAKTVPGKKRNPRKRKNGVGKTRHPKFRTDALREALLKKDSDIPSIVEEAGLPSKYVTLFQILLGNNRNKKEAARASGFHYNRVHEWSDWLGFPSKTKSQTEIRSHIILELSQGNISRKELAARPGIDKHILDEVIATMGLQGTNNHKPLEIAVRAASEANPDYSNRQIKELLGERFNFNYVCDIRRKLLRSSDRLPDGITAARLFLNAAIELVKRQIESEDSSRLTNITRRARQACWISKLKGKTTWPTSTATFPGTTIPKYRLLAAALTEYLSEAGITGAEDLKARMASGLVQLPQLPLPIFQAFHLVMAVCDVTDRLKIQHGPKQSWLPSVSQMIIKSKQVLGYIGNKPPAVAAQTKAATPIRPKVAQQDNNVNKQAIVTLKAA